MNKLVLKPGREKSLKRRHPWVFSGAISKIVGTPAVGETVEIQGASGEFLAIAAYSPQSQIVARVWDWQKREIDAVFFRERIEKAVAMRLCLLPQIKFSGGTAIVARDDGLRPNAAPPARPSFLSDAETKAPGAFNSMRLVHAESDGLPGVVIDRYEDIVVLQLSSAGAMHWRGAIADAIEAVVQPKSIFERSDGEVLIFEGMKTSIGLLRGTALPSPLLVQEGGLIFEINVAAGHKTGFYLDQRDNRRIVRALANGKKVLDCFAYSGGFTVNALAGRAAETTAIESSASAMSLLKRNVALNGFQPPECIEGDVFQELRKLRDTARHFDLIVLDPPKFAPTAHHIEKAARAYKDINLLALKLLAPGGLLCTFSCSGGVSRDLFQKIVAGAALDARVPAQIVAPLSAGNDHPVGLSFPEGEYLKGFLIRAAAH